ncbi:hypothetical protein PINS_up006262 [Pythium insidiosum]|nr:hypothetical protein PINS_up006262 [Pythium insidiosum]
MRRWIVEASLSAVALLWMHPFVFKLYAYNCERSTRSHERTASALRAVVISDVHLLGKRRRSWIERMWIDWQVRESIIAFAWCASRAHIVFSHQIASAVKAAVDAHVPDLVLFLGDQLDEGIERTELSVWQVQWKDAKTYDRIFT